MGSAGLPYSIGMTPTDVHGWHGRNSRFNIVFGDGHAAAIQLRSRNDMYRPSDFNTPSTNRAWRWWKFHWRAPKWRYDHFPMPTFELPYFSPFVGPDRRLYGV